MMPDFSWMQTDSVAHMFDTCHRMVYSFSAGTLNQEKPIYTESNTDLLCGFSPDPGSLTIEQDKTVITWDGTLRLPLGTTLDVRDRIKLTKRFGQVQSSPITYDIVAPPQVGPTCLRILLKEVKE